MEQGAVIELVDSYPPPPPYYKLYTDENVELGSAPEPPAPVRGAYSMFGQLLTTEDQLPSLDELGRVQLYPKGDDINHTEELRRINHSVLFNYLELVNILIHNPKEWRKKVEEIDLLFINMHHLLNSYRPHQARQTLIAIMENQVQRRVKTLEEANSRFKEVEKILQEAAEQLYGHDIPHINEADRGATEKDVAPGKVTSKSVEEQEEEKLFLQMESILDSIVETV